VTGSGTPFVHLVEPGASRAVLPVGRLPPVHADAVLARCLDVAARAGCGLAVLASAGRPEV
jgi:hypothetical protein